MTAIRAATATNLVRKKKKTNQFILEKNILDQKQSHGKKNASVTFIVSALRIRFTDAKLRPAGLKPQSSAPQKSTAQ